MSLVADRKVGCNLAALSRTRYLAFDPTGSYLYCLDSYHALLHVLSVNTTTGKLSEPTAPTALNVAAGNEPLGLAVIQY